MCSRTSPRFLAASTINSSRSRTFTWPVNSLNAGGRSEISNAASGSGGFIEIVNRYIVTSAARVDSKSGANSDSRITDQASRQILRQHQLGAAALVNVIDLVKSGTNKIKTESAWFDQIVRAAFHFVRENFFAVISQPHAHTFAQSFHLQRNELIVAQTVRIADDVRTCFIHAEHHHHSLLVGERIAVQEITDAFPQQREVRRVTAKFDFASFHRSS